MAEEKLLDRALYKKIKGMDRDSMEKTIQNIYNMGRDSVLKEENICSIDMAKIREEISQIKGIGENRLNQIMDILDNNLNSGIETK